MKYIILVIVILAVIGGGYYVYNINNQPKNMGETKNNDIAEMTNLSKQIYGAYKNKDIEQVMTYLELEILVSPPR